MYRSRIFRALPSVRNCHSRVDNGLNRRVHFAPILIAHMGASSRRSPGSSKKRPALIVSVAVSALFLAIGRGAAADGTDPLAGARRLQEHAQSLGPLPDSGSGITRDVDSIAIIEHDGSNYDATDADGVPNYAARVSVTQRFYQTHGDFYDFLVVFTNFEFKTRVGSVDALAFHN